MPKLITRIFLPLIFIFLAILTFSFVVQAAEKLPFNTPTPAPLVEYDLPYPGILPDHPLYFLKLIRDKILILSARNLTKKSELYLLFADKHLSMGQLLREKGNLDLSTTTFAKGEKYLLQAAIQEVKLKNQNNLLVGEANKFDLASRKHEEILGKIIDATSDKIINQRLVETLGITHQAIQQIALLK